MAISDEDIRWLFALLESEGLAEVEVHQDGNEILVRRLDATVLAAPYMVGDAGAGLEGHGVAAEPTLPEGVIPVIAPMSGAFYRAPSPESPAYVEVGQPVEAGDTVGLIEAMKLFNDVPAGAAGTVYALLAENEQHVEAGQPLILIQT
jgi:acetyl-CoA carboxylase biotin carboxyl carrier protein